MNIHCTFRRVVLVGLSLAFVTGLAFAQSSGSSAKGGNRSGESIQSSKTISVGDAELKKFAAAIKDVHVIQIGFQKDFHKAVTQSSLGSKKFFQIYRTQRSTHKLPSTLSSQQKQQYQQLFKKVIGMERKAQRAMVATVKKDGFVIARFNAIVKAVHTNKKLADRLKKLM